METKSPFFRPSGGGSGSSSSSYTTGTTGSTSRNSIHQRNEFVVVQQATPKGRHYSRSLIVSNNNSNNNSDISSTTIKTTSSKTSLFGTGSTTTSTTTTRPTTRKSTMTMTMDENENDKEEQKSTILGATTNLINAIVGCGIVGIPYALKCSGFVAGMILIIFSAIVTEKSLRLLINTAKHVHVSTYETAMESSFGSFGFYFVTINMFIVAYGGMISYLMIIKDSFSSVLLHLWFENTETSTTSTNTNTTMMADTAPLRRSILFLISVCIVVPLSCQRDMASLAITSRISVLIDIGIVGIILYTTTTKLLVVEQGGNNINTTTGTDISVSENIIIIDNNNQTSLLSSSSEVQEGAAAVNHPFSAILYHLLTTDIIHYDTIFVGLGVLSFAFVCQHSAYIIAGSLQKPTVERWSFVTMTALTICTLLALICGISGYVGYLDQTAGNILMNLDTNSVLTTIARTALGSCMLFVYPLDSFVTRHVCIALFFTGRIAHEGNYDTLILNRYDRRILLTLFLYVLAVVPAAAFENLGTVLAITGAVGGSCLSYIGPGILYLGVHGKEFINLVNETFWMMKNNTTTNIHHPERNNNSMDPLDKVLGVIQKQEDLRAIESTPLQKKKKKMNGINLLPHDDDDEEEVEKTILGTTIQFVFYFILYYATGMPLWCYIAGIGNKGLQHHIHEMTLKSPHPIRIGDVVYKRILIDRNDNDDDVDDSSSLLETTTSKSNNTITIVGGGGAGVGSNKVQQAMVPHKLLLQRKLDYAALEDNDEDDDSDANPETVRKDQTTPFFAQSDTNRALRNKGITAISFDDHAIRGTKSSHDNMALGMIGTVDQQIGQKLLNMKKNQQKRNNMKGHKNGMSVVLDKEMIEQDPQAAPPTWYDFSLAIFYIVFGLVAMIAGLVSLGYSE